MTATLDYVRQLAVSKAMATETRTAKRNAHKEWWQLGPDRHRGVAYYDKQRLAKQLPAMPSATYDAPPSWAVLPDTFGEWQPTPANHFHATWCAATESAGDEAATVKATSEYTLARNPEGYGMGYPVRIKEHREYDSETKEWRTIPAVTEWHFRSLPWSLTFADGSTFDFTSRAIADAALSQLIKIRKAKPHNPDSRAAVSTTFFTPARLRKLPADATPGDTEAADDTEQAATEAESETESAAA